MQIQIRKQIQIEKHKQVKIQIQIKMCVQVDVMNSYMLNGCTDISPVIDSYTDALLDVFPQVININKKYYIFLIK